MILMLFSCSQIYLGVSEFSHEYSCEYLCKWKVWTVGILWVLILVLFTRQEHRKCKLVEVEVDDCLCGLKVNPKDDGMIQCKWTGCETQWVCEFIFWLSWHWYDWYITYSALVWWHLTCVYLEQVPKDWVCEACVSSKGGQGGKTACCQCQISIFRHVPDNIMVMWVVALAKWLKF